MHTWNPVFVKPLQRLALLTQLLWLVWGVTSCPLAAQDHCVIKKMTANSAKGAAASKGANARLY
jgi:hypothetical protein